MHGTLNCGWAGMINNKYILHDLCHLVYYPWPYHTINHLWPEIEYPDIYSNYNYIK